ncbi:hypothetical protein [Halomarina pelagica]|uniref:hypothetical protein n=1 Tax=Halomarina pelagica TaxID=2961599 RepID=UPI0020C2CE22|nr:hypothetical protein [Halomarina sp. BND7]
MFDRTRSCRAAVREHDLAVTREVAETVGVTRQGADYRHRKLEAEGFVLSKKIGRELVWMVAEKDAE